MIRQMLVVLVHVHVLADSVERFKEATRANAAASRRKPGVAQFDLIQQSDDPTRFVIIEVYRSNEAAAAHKETNHYKSWRDTVASMMAEPRVGIKYTDADEAWPG